MLEDLCDSLQSPLPSGRDTESDQPMFPFPDPLAQNRCCGITCLVRLAYPLRINR